MPPAGNAHALPVLVPVPLHRWRLWSRGFNQAALLVQELAKMGKGEAAIDALVRVRRTPKLGTLGREEREKTLGGAIRLGSGVTERLKARNIVLVDDVVTSGATSRACLAALATAAPASLAVTCFAVVEQDHKPTTP
jgi:predicted amidophosphoribosyltransferase